MQTLVHGAARHATSIEALLDQVPALKEVLSACAESLSAKGVPDITPMPSLLAHSEESNLANKWRIDACTRCLESFESGASDHAVGNVVGQEVVAGCSNQVKPSTASLTRPS